MKDKITIIEILDNNSGDIINVNEILKKTEEEQFTIRRKIEMAIQQNEEPIYKCCVCGEAVKLVGGQSRHKQRLHFRHYKNDSNCPLIEEKKYSKEVLLAMKFQGAKESKPHKRLKNSIADSLRKNMDQRQGIAHVDVEKTFKDGDNPYLWKRPDVQAKYNDLSLVFEIQLATTFLSVIVAREEFYKHNDTHLIWVFNKFYTEEAIQRFTEKDIYYNNNFNVFVLDEEAMKIAQDKNDLVLHCYFKTPKLENGCIVLEWADKFVTLDDLTFDRDSHKVYYFDVFGEKSRFENDCLNNPSYWHPLSTERNLKFIDSLLKRLSVKYPNQTPFQKILMNFRDGRECEKQIMQFFYQGNRLAKQDYKFLNEEYKFAIENSLQSNYCNYLRIIVLGIFHAKVQKCQLSNKSHELLLNWGIKIELLVILSIKEEIVIGSNYSYLMSFLFNSIKDYVNCDFYLKAITKYITDKKFDKKYNTTKFRKKINEHLENKKNKIKNHENIVRCIFPELFS